MEKLTVEQALEALLEHTKVIEETETVPLLQACGRVLAKDMIAGFDNPPFDRSPVDGYACKAEDITDASESHPVQLTVLEEIDAGQYSRVTVEKGQAVRIMTGAAIPKGCDCCVRQEDTDYGEETVRIFRPTGQWQNYCYQGENFKNRTVLLKKGDKIGFIEAGILASMGVIKVKVYRRVRVAKFKKRMKELTCRSWGVSNSCKVEKLNQLIRGWINYFKIGSMKRLCKELDSRIRYRLRMCIWKQWKTPQNRIKNLMKLGVDKDTAWITAYTGSRIAYVCQRRVMNFAINKERLTQFGLVSMIDYYTKRCVTC